MMKKRFSTYILLVFSVVLMASSHAASTTLIGAVLGFEIHFSELTNTTTNITPTSDHPTDQHVKLSVVQNTEGSNSFIYYHTNVNKSINAWTTMIDHFLEPYRSRSENRVPCSFGSGPVGDKQVCDVPVDEFHPCTPANQYNYERGAPCIFLKLDKILNWKPEPFNDTENVPEDMPLDLKMHIGEVSGRPEANNVWVSCKGVNEHDEKLLGPIQYIPRRGFPAYYFPDTNKEGYLSPLVAVLFEKPATGVVVSVQCTVWARNIAPHGRGSSDVTLQLKVDRE